MKNAAFWGVFADTIICCFPAFGADLPTIKNAGAEASMITRKPGQAPVSEGPTITVGGDAAEVVKPTLAILTLAAVDEKPTLSAAASLNTKMASDLVAAIKKLGVADEDIHPGSLDLHPLFKDRTDPKTQDVIEHRFLGYRAETIYRVHIRNVDEAPSIARKLVESGTDSYRGLGFVADDSDERFDALRAKAIANAMKRAVVYSHEASLKLGEIVQIAPNGVQYRSNPEEADSQRNEGDSQIAISVPSSPTLKPMRASVKVTWQLLPQDASSCTPNPDQK
jgi:uncharacterized protein YggE